MTANSRRLALAYFRALRDLGEQEVFCASRHGFAPAGLAECRSLEAIAREIESCRACSLHATRRRAVPGAGNPSTGLVMVGEAPGEQEDLQGAPFVGASGQLLRRLFAAVGIRDDRYYLVNVLKCRPPGNRNPTQEEMQACGRFLEAQLQILAPRLIVCLGKYAGSQVLGRHGASIRELRGESFRREGAVVVVTYHPSALLHRAEFRADAWRDMKRIRRLADRLAIDLVGSDS